MVQYQQLDQNTVHCVNLFYMLWEKVGYNAARKICARLFKADPTAAACVCAPGGRIPRISGRCHLTSTDVHKNFLDLFNSVKDQVGKCPHCSKDLFTVNKLADCFTTANLEILVDHLTEVHGARLVRVTSLGTERL